MVKKNQITVKQPEIGQKLLELRRAKGFTQEELVDRCNINVRTIQRIEAGEVTPRMFTIKTILEALGYDLDVLQFQERNEVEVETNPGLNPDAPMLKAAFYLGLAYFILAFVESFFDMEIWGWGAYPTSSFQETIPFFAYLSIKLVIFVTFSGFMFGFYRMASGHPNTLVKITAMILAGLTLVYCAVDCYSYYIGKGHLNFLVVEAVAFGIVYVFFGVGIMKYRKTFGDLAFFGGIVGAVTGFCFMTVILAIPGFILLTVFEIILLVLLYRAIEHTTRKYQPTPDVTPA